LSPQIKAAEVLEAVRDEGRRTRGHTMALLEEVDASLLERLKLLRAEAALDHEEVCVRRRWTVVFGCWSQPWVRLTDGV
jgi:hypothetical protein